MGEIEDIANATVFLCADTGSFINGATIDVDGGAWRVRAAKAAQQYPFDLLRPWPRQTLSKPLGSKI